MHFVIIFLQSLFYTEVLGYIEIILICVQLLSKPHPFSVNFIIISIACIACNRSQVWGFALRAWGFALRASTPQDDPTGRVQPATSSAESRFRVDVRSEPSLAENQADCVHPLASLAYQAQTWLRFAPLESGRSYPGGQVQAGRCSVHGMVADPGALACRTVADSTAGGPKFEFTCELGQRSKKP